MKDKVYNYLLSLMSGSKHENDYKENFTVADLTSKEKGVIGYSYLILSRALVRVKTSMKSVYRIEFFNYQDLSKDIKPMIDSKYEVKETIQEKLRLITIDVAKDENVLMNALSDLENVLKEKMFDIFLNYSTVMAFGCCGRYVQCSDERRCIMHDIDPLYARGCQYRANLEAGRIFYGKNRNVDKHENTEETVSKEEPKLEEIKLF